MDSTVKAAMIAAIVALIGTLLNWWISIKNISNETRYSYSQYIIEYKKQCIKLIQFSQDLDKDLKALQSDLNHQDNKTLDSIFSNTGHRNESLETLSTLRTKGIILYPNKRLIINHIFQVATQGHCTKIQRGANWPKDPHEPWITNLVNHFPAYPQNIYVQLEKSVNNYSLILYLLKSRN